MCCSAAGTLLWPLCPAIPYVTFASQLEAVSAANSAVSTQSAQNLSFAVLHTLHLQSFVYGLSSKESCFIQGSTACDQHGAWHNRCSRYIFKKHFTGMSLVDEWLRTHLPVLGTRVQPLVWEDPPGRGAIESVCHSYWSPRALEPACCNQRSRRQEKTAHRS